MAVLNKTVSTLLSVQKINSGAVLLSAAQTVTTKLAASIYVLIGRDTTTALTVPAVVRLLGQGDNSSQDSWISLAQASSSTATANTASTSSSGNTSGQTSVTTTGSFGGANGAKIFFKNGTAANSEFNRLASGSGGTALVTVFNLTNTQNSQTVLDQADEIVFNVDLSGIETIELEIDNIGTGQAIWVAAFLVTADSFA